ncbi:hypothetical protein EMPS_10326 [Entomortierella parvispora]|uniref:Transmembrane protein n=1 Tax=Entomortierella parvispora TaxID=205924 RepID=A0A9P3HJU1_9FUNG|nr:hypothetical protein EMPS_10326 [Entomortierella parvispora]
MNLSYQSVQDNEGAVALPLSPVQPAKHQQKLSRKLFFLTAFSLSSAALMGSAVGLVVYQSRQLYILNRASQFQFMRTPFDHSSQQSPYRPYYENQGSNHTGGAMDSTATHSGHHRHHFHGHHGHHWKFLIISTWLPVLVWLSTMLASSVWMASRRWFSRYISAKRGIQVSQWIFYSFWIMISAADEVQRDLFELKRSTKGMDQVAEAMDDSNAIDVSFEVKAKIRQMITPLTVMLVVAVGALGLATGLLTASSTVMERELYKEFEEVEDQLLEDGMSRNVNDTKTEKEKDATTLSSISSSSRTASTKKMHYSKAQLLKLACLILALLGSQMKVFQWVIQPESKTFDIFGTVFSVSGLALLLGPNVCVAMFILATVAL